MHADNSKYPINFVQQDAYTKMRKSFHIFLTLFLLSQTIWSQDFEWNAGFDGFLGKPLDPDSFPAPIGRILSGDPVWELQYKQNI